eukprot:gene14378-15909_t
MIFHPPPTMTSLGVSLDGIKDWNKDGFDDIAMTGLGKNGQTMIYIIYGSNVSASTVTVNVTSLMSGGGEPTTHRPSFSPTINVSQPFSVVDVTSSGKVSGAANTNQRFIITASDVTTITGGSGMKRYVVYPASNATLIITDFQVTSDVIDLTNFPSSLQQVSYRTSLSSLVLLLDESNGQRIILLSLTSYSLLSSYNSIMYASPSTNTTTSSSSSSTSITSFSSFFVVVSSLLPLNAWAAELGGETVLPH